MYTLLLSLGNSMLSNETIAALNLINPSFDWNKSSIRELVSTLYMLDEKELAMAFKYIKPSSIDERYWPLFLKNRKASIVFCPGNVWCGFCPFVWADLLKTDYYTFVDYALKYNGVVKLKKLDKVGLRIVFKDDITLIKRIISLNVGQEG